MPDSQLCTMCEAAPATTSYGFPVCGPCKLWLEGLDAALAREEAADPELKRRGDAIRRAEGEPPIHP